MRRRRSPLILGFILEIKLETRQERHVLQDTLAGGARNQTWAWP